MNFVPCLTWIRKGVAKATPDKIELTKEELRELINDETKKESNDDVLESEEEMNVDENLKDEKDRESEEDGNGEEESSPSTSQVTLIKVEPNKIDEDDFSDVIAKYSMDSYDEETDTPLGNIANLAVYPSSKDDPHMNDSDNESCSDDDDFFIRPDDNIIALGHVVDDVGILEIYVYNGENDYLYVHHDIILPAFPLAIEWMNFDPTDDKPCNYVAVGDMTSTINIWDIDVVNSMEPAFCLSGKKKKKKQSASMSGGHTDAVLDLSWNKNIRNILASGSADCQLILWDLSIGKPIVIFNDHKSKVQSIAWHPCEFHNILSSSCDGTVHLYDDRKVNDGFKNWIVEGEVEKVLWDHFDPLYFLVSNDRGNVYYFDVRSKSPIFSVSAHTESVTGLALSSQCPGLLISSSTDQLIKVWDIQTKTPQFVMEKNCKLGSILTSKSCPDIPFVVAIGGDKRSSNFGVFDLQDDTLNAWFGKRQLVQPVLNIGNAS